MVEIEDVVKGIRASGIQSKDIPYRNYTEAGFDEEFAAQVRELRETSQAIEAAEAEKRRLQDIIKGKLALRNVDRARVDELKVLVYQGSRSTVDKKLLLENGVPLDKIELSTKTSEFLVVKITHE